MPPSACSIVAELDNGPKCSKELLDAVECSTRTVRYAIKTLLEEDLITKEPVLLDMRQTRYRLSVKVMKERVQIELHSRPG